MIECDHGHVMMTITMRWMNLGLMNGIVHDPEMENLHPGIGQGHVMMNNLLRPYVMIGLGLETMTKRLGGDQSLEPDRALDLQYQQEYRWQLNLARRLTCHLH